MNKNRICKTAAVVCAFSLFLSLLPVIYCSFFNYATGDDLGYSGGLRQAMAGGESLAGLIKLIASEVRTSYHVWQGTWSSLFLFHLQPGIYGERWYTLTTWIALACILGGTAMFLHEILCRLMRHSRSVFIAVFSLVSLISVQYMPKIRGGLFWYTSIAHYIIPYGFSLLVLAWSLRFLSGGKRRYLFFMAAACAYLGGAGYPEIVLTLVWLFFVFFLEITGITKLSTGKGSRRIWLLLIPFLLETAGFLVSAAAPGNSVRGGEDFGFSVSRVFSTIFGAIWMGASETLGYFVRCPLLIIMILVTGVLAWTDFPERMPADTDEEERICDGADMPAGWKLAVVAVLGFLLTCAVRAPEVYAGVEVSGGVPDTYFLVGVLYLALLSAGLGSLAGVHYPVDRRFRPVMITVSLICAVVLFLGAKAAVKNSNDFICINYVRSGQLKDFTEQMEERLRILEDDSIKEVILPEMNDEQGPFMHMPLLRDPNAFTNWATANYYGKSSVIAVPREEYNRIREASGPD